MQPLPGGLLCDGSAADLATGPDHHALNFRRRYGIHRLFEPASDQAYGVLVPAPIEAIEGKAGTVCAIQLLLV